MANKIIDPEKFSGLKTRVGITMPVEVAGTVKSMAALDIKPDGKLTTSNEKYLELLILAIEQYHLNKKAN